MASAKQAKAARANIRKAAAAARKKIEERGMDIEIEEQG